MLRNLPHHTIKYLLDELPPFTGILLIKTNEQGNIIDFHGPHEKYLRSKPEIGKPIHEYVPALFSMIPPLISPMVLNRIQSNSSVYADIHLIESTQSEFLIFIVDQTHEVDSIREIIQKMNESKLNSDSNKSVDKNNDFNPFVVFDYLSMEITGVEAVINSEIPSWFRLLKPEYSKNDRIDISDVFPYFEVFNFEANDFWEKKKNGKIKSGIWTETLTDGEDIYLTAYATYHNNKRYILIKPEENINKEQLDLQLAREQKLAYEKLEKAKKKLKILLEYKDKFVSIVSHDLRSPVAAVLGIVEMLVNDKDELSKLNDFYVEMVHSIQDEMLRLLDYNDKLYHWSNLELGNFEIVKRKESLKRVIETARRTADQKLLAKNISFSTNLEDDDVIVNIDITLFLQVLNNLLSNAIKFTPENGSIAIDIINSKSLQIAIIDSGVGMPKKICDNIFSGFARNSSMGTQGEKGTGLGLGIVKKIVDAHGFTIIVESELGKGSQFIIGMA